MRASVRRFFGVTNARQVWLITIAHGVNEFYTVAIPPIIPLLVAQDQLTYAQTGTLITVYLLMYTILQVPAGIVADRFGSTRLLSVGMALLSGGILVVGLAPTYGWMIVGQVIAGVGGATYHPSGMSLISDLEAGTTMGRAMGIHTLGGIVGSALAPVLIGGFAVVLTWRKALIVGAFVGVVYAIAFWLLFSHPDRSTISDRSLSPTSDRPEGLREHVNASFVVPLEWWVLGLFAANFLIALQVGVIRAFGPAYLFVRVAESTAVANGIYVALLVGGGISSIGSGYLADKYDQKAMGAGVLVVSAAAIVGTSFVPQRPAIFLFWFFLLGIILYAVFPAMNALTAAYSDRAYSGGLFGITLSAASLGAATGALVFGLLAEWMGITAAFPLTAVVSVFGFVSFLLMFRV